MTQQNNLLSSYINHIEHRNGLVNDLKEIIDAKTPEDYAGVAGKYTCRTIMNVVPQLKVMKIALEKNPLGKITLEGVDQLCNLAGKKLYNEYVEYTKNNNISLTQEQYKLAEDLILGNKTSVQSSNNNICVIDSLDDFGKTPTAISTIRQTQNKVNQIDRNFKQEHPQEYQKALEEQQQKQTEEALLINNSPEQTNSFFDKVGKAVISIESVEQFASLIATDVNDRAYV